MRTHRRPERRPRQPVTPPNGGHGNGDGAGQDAERWTRPRRRDGAGRRTAGAAMETGGIRTPNGGHGNGDGNGSGRRTAGTAARPGPYHPVFAALAADQAMYVGIVRQITHDHRIADAGRHEIFRFADLAGIIGPAHPEPVSEIIDGALFTEIAVHPSPVSGPVSDAFGPRKTRGEHRTGLRPIGIQPLFHIAGIRHGRPDQHPEETYPQQYPLHPVHKNVFSVCKNTKNSENIQRRNCKSVARTSPTTTTTTTTTTAPNCNPNSNSNRTRLPRHLRTPSRTPGPHTENSGHEHRNSAPALSHKKRASASRNPLLHRTAPKPSLSISKSPIRGTRAEYLRRLPSRPHRPHWDPWRASAGSL